jgi:hypothetical protein
MILTGLPRPVPRERYLCAIEEVLRPLREHPAVQAVYQVGGIRTPGISDVDLLVVFRDGSSCQLDPLANLGRDDRYLFPHNQFGLPAEWFASAVRFGFFHDYRLLYGQQIAADSSPLPAIDVAAVNRQAGLEYLLKMFISMSVEHAYGIARVRNLLLLGRALRYDLQYVGAEDGAVGRLVDQVIDWRERWFSAPPRPDEIVDWFERMYRALGALLGELFGKWPLFVPEWADLRIAANMRIEPGARFSADHAGFTLPARFGGIGRRYFNLQHRFNRFRFYVPVTHAAPAVVMERHELVAAMREYNRRFLPFFNAVPMAIGIFTRQGTA